jgi:hypothetical protein
MPDQGQEDSYFWGIVQMMEFLMHLPIACISVIISTVVSSATETEYAAAFIVGQAAISIIHTLADLAILKKKLKLHVTISVQLALQITSLSLKDHRLLICIITGFVI